MEEVFDPISLISLVPIHKDQAIGDIGCGPGYLSIPLAKYAYDGRLYAIDVQEEMLEYVRNGAERARLSNVETVVSKENTIPLEDGLLDGAVVANTLHEATRPSSLLKETARLLKKGGWLAVVEWAPAEDEPVVGPPAKNRIAADRVAEWAAGLGLRRVMSRELSIHHYIIVFRK
jgi:ubiquinone/menaquinone biosynthesis C-methylase UbiE